VPEELYRIVDELDARTRAAAEGAAARAGLGLEAWIEQAIRGHAGRDAGNRRHVGANGRRASPRRSGLVLMRALRELGAGPFVPAPGHSRACAGGLRGDEIRVARGAAAAEAARISAFAESREARFAHKATAASRPLSRWIMAAATLPMLILGLAWAGESLNLDFRWVGWLWELSTLPVTADTAVAPGFTLALEPAPPPLFDTP